MKCLEIKRDILTKARDRSALTPEELQMVETKFQEITQSTHTLDVGLEELPVAFWRSMLHDSRLTTGQRAIIARFVYGMNGKPANAAEIYSSVVSSPVEFGSSFATLGNKSPNAELFMHGRWYPVIVHCQFLEDEGKIARDVLLLVRLSICETIVERRFAVYRDLFLDEQGSGITCTILDVLLQLGLRPLQTSSAEYNLRLVKAERQSREVGKVMVINSPALLRPSQSWWGAWSESSVGTAVGSQKGVVEPELETDEERGHYYGRGRNEPEGVSRLPFVRLFCLDIKRYVYADVDDITEYEFDTGALENLCLPGEMLSVLTRVFATPVERLFGDLIRGKHGGVIVLASGKPGVGKTLTAEIYAERNERPLYVLEMGELGTTAEQVEQHLRNVFARVTRWNAVLQFDECEIFLAKRNDDLERSAIVGIFLRLLDYYQGMLFLTSNRPEVIDEAVLSRVMLRLAYPDLNLNSRREIWRNMLRAAAMQVDDETIAAISEWKLNGRQIRNLTRLARILFPTGKVSLAEMQEVRRFGQHELSVSGE